MRLVFGIVAAMALVGSSVTVQAYEKFLPLGTGYSTEVSELPPLNSAAEALAVQSDVYETKIYNEQLEAKKRDSYLQRFMFHSENSGSDFSVDY